MPIGTPCLRPRTPNSREAALIGKGLSLMRIIVIENLLTIYEGEMMLNINLASLLTLLCPAGVDLHSWRDMLDLEEAIAGTTKSRRVMQSFHL